MRAARRYSLIERSESSGTVSMHRLVQDVQRRQLARVSASWKAAVRLVSALLEEAIPSVDDNATLEEARSVGPLLTHLHALMAASPTGEMPTGLMSAGLFDKAAERMDGAASMRSSSS